MRTLPFNKLDVLEIIITPFAALETLRETYDIPEMPEIQVDIDIVTIIK